MIWAAVHVGSPLIEHCIATYLSLWTSLMTALCREYRAKRWHVHGIIKWYVYAEATIINK